MVCTKKEKHIYIHIYVCVCIVYLYIYILHIHTSTYKCLINHSRYMYYIYILITPASSMLSGFAQPARAKKASSAMRIPVFISELLVHKHGIAGLCMYM